MSDEPHRYEIEVRPKVMRVEALKFGHIGEITLTVEGLQGLIEMVERANR